MSRNDHHQIVERLTAAEPAEALAALNDAAAGAIRTAPPSAIAQDPELLSDFILESREHLVNIEFQVLTLERDATDTEALNSVFRGFHTIKGLAGFLELWDVQKLAHEVETVLDGARNGELTIESEGIDVILVSADYLNRWLTHLESSLQGHASEPPGLEPALLDSIHALSQSGQPAAQDLASLAVAVNAAGVANTARSGPNLPAAVAQTPRRNETWSVKVDTAKLDYLVDMAGEMVIAESLVRHDPGVAAIKNPRLQRHMAQLTRITAELQKTAMAMRLVPVGSLFQRMARLVRDLSHQLGKRVEMVTEGESIELDRSIVEELADPLMHMVRNAMDHGVETSAARAQTDKNPTARLLLKAYHQAGQVVIEISDDGRGLDRNAIAAKAVEKGLIKSAHGLQDSEVYNLIFEPGFSTAAQLTNVSGRGVGMDVVRKHVEKLRGRIEIRSTAGHGSTFLLKLPLTLAIIDGIVAGVGSERYIVPIFAIREIFRPSADTLWTIHQKNEMALVRGGLMPVTRLYQRFNVKPKSEDPTQCVLIVAEVEGARFGLLVDELIGKQEVMIKPLGEIFRGVPGIAGGAILGDGRVGLILDLERIFKDRAADACH